MLTFKNKLFSRIPYQFDPNMSIKASDLLFFDIETTGLSADISNIYLIGCCCYEENNWQMIQWFADDYISEEKLLHNFLKLLSRHKILIHYNGSGFDIPYMKKKLEHYHIDFSFDNFLSIDLYKKIKPYKTLLNLPNIKQTSMENFLSIQRKDTFNGGELIQVYIDYMKHRLIRKQNSSEYLEQLLLHNKEDISSLLPLTAVLAYSDLFEKKHTITNAYTDNVYLHLDFTLENPVQNPIFCKNDEIILAVENATVSLQVKILYDELKYFYKNYKEYYYLPLEDKAIHQSIAQFVDKKHKVKAKASTCYTRKQGPFLPQFSLHSQPEFKHYYKEKNTYMELNNIFLSNSTIQSEYVTVLLKNLLNQNKKILT